MTTERKPNQIVLETGKPRWFSENPDKAWGEKFFLIYSPIWILQMALSSVFGWNKSMTNVTYVIQSCFVALPLAVVPLLVRSEAKSGKKWYDTYWFKANLFVFIFSFFGNYFGSEYFFDVLGMIYHYPRITWNFDSSLVGSGERVVPVTMYILTQAYFMTYHTTAIIVLRRIRTSRLPGMKYLFPVFVFAIGYFWAWLETRMMANPFVADNFRYEDLDRMLVYGSVMYALYFIASFPVFYGIDERKAGGWSVPKTAAAALSVSMITFFLLDFATKMIGHI